MIKILIIFHMVTFKLTFLVVNPHGPVEIEINGRMQWQKNREYGRRNYSELGVQRYQRTFGDAMHARDFPRQQQEAMIASGALNKMTSLGMPQSRRSA